MPESCAIRDFIATYDQYDPEDRAIRTRLIEQLYSELYRRERESFSEWIAFGGEG